MPEGRRIPSLDVFRYLAVSFALVAHVILYYSLDDVLGEVPGLAVTALTRLATPSLLILFGVMVEIVYVRRYRSSPARAVVALIHRAIVCYLCFVLLAAIGAIFGHISAKELVGAAVLVTTAPYATIFKLYAILLPIAIGLVWLRDRFGLPGVWLLALLIWTADLAVIGEAGSLPGHFAHLGSVLLGFGDQWGPSIFHGLYLVIAGMTVGRAFYTGGPHAAARLATAVLAILSLAVLAHATMGLGVMDVLWSVADMRQWRGNNHIAYYSYGILGGLVIIGMSPAITRVLPADGRATVSAIGGSTLVYFFIGNAMLLVTPQEPVTSPIVAALLPAAWLVVAGAATLAFDALSARSRMAQAPSNLIQGFVRKRVGALLQDPA